MAACDLALTARRRAPARGYAACVQTPSGHTVDSTPATRLVVLASGAGSNLAALLAAHDAPAYGARVVGLVTDKPAAGALDLARDAGVASAVVAPADFEDRAAWDRGITEAVAVFRPDVVVLAGFMRILAPGFLDRFPGRVVNTHPALLPSFPGAHAVRDALAHGVRVTGCTVHVVDAGVDTGPILAQAAVPVLDGDDEATLHERIKVAERALLVETVGRIAREGLTVRDGRATIGA
ncbi:phosphoribosylglycinamide formyltransferase [Xylanimonas ulmi]|uniref:Phosphoribosylglycinamide formyltransferase n=1 Tax=Xylanimonas ulmi TaxID=228973 RepID=A0A4Q7M945_9MICO|nr:formyltetrahydrofolate-dependent phosphoribosylglycinamide formyltransferase [Xylanibacterium ulmi]